MARNSTIKNRGEDNKLIEEWSKKLLGLFHNGIKSIKSNDLARYLGVSKPTLYKYFSSKDEIVEAVVSYVIKELEQKNTNLSNHCLSFKERYLDFILNSLELSLLISNELLADLKTYYPHQFSRTLDLVSHCDEHFKEFYKEGIKKGIVRDIHPAVITVSNRMTMMQILEPHFLMQNEITFQDAFNSFVQLQLHGIFTEGNEESQEIQNTLKNKLKEIIENHNRGN